MNAISPDLKFSVFVDLVLVKLYELDRINRSSSKIFNLFDLRYELKEQIPQDWFFDAAKVLETRDLAQCTYTRGGVYARITGEGRLFVEEQKGNVRQIEDNRSNYFITVSGSNNQVVAGQQTGATTQTMSNDQSEGPWGQLFETIEKNIAEDASLDDVEKEQARSYVKVVRGEMRKHEPNRNIIAAVLDPLSQIVSIASQVAMLIKAFNG